MELVEAVRILQSSHRERDETPWQTAVYTLLADLQLRVARLDGTIIESPGCGGDDIDVKPLSERVRVADQTSFTLGLFRGWADEIAAMERELSARRRLPL